MKKHHSERTRGFVFLSVAVTVALAVLVPAVPVMAQGSIYGLVALSDFSTPLDPELVFFGYLNQTNNEIRLSGSDGAGYEGGYWYDDFQNYVGEAPGIPYDYHFFDTGELEYHNLSKLVPSNSFQIEDVELAPISFPNPPEILSARRIDPVSIKLTWSSVVGASYHVFRREASSNGSFFRIDDPSGNLAVTGWSDTTYVDSQADSLSVWQYVVVARLESGQFSPPSTIAQGNDSSCCVDLTGNIDGDPADLVDMGDLTKLIDFLFISYTPLTCPEEANIDGDPGGNVDIGDLTLLINFLFITYTPPAPCL